MKKKDVKTTVIAALNLLILAVLMVLLLSDKMSTEEFVIALAAITSALTSVLGYFSADSKEEDL